MSYIHIGNAPCSWGTLEFEGLDGNDIGYPQMLDELADTGYAGTELGDWGYMPTDGHELREELERRNLTMLGAFVPVRFRDPAHHQGGEDHALKVARLLAAVASTGDPAHEPFVVLSDDNGADELRRRHAGRIDAGMGLSDAEWDTFSRGVERIAGAVRAETGLPSVFHHHCAGFVETPAEIDRLLGSTDPDLVGLVFDTGHYAFGAGDCRKVDEGLDRFRDRIKYMHFKDCDPEVADRSRREGWDYFESLRHGLFCELGQGGVDFPGVLEMLRSRQYQGWIVVEQDVLPGMGSPRASAERNRGYLRTIGL